MYRAGSNWYATAMSAGLEKWRKRQMMDKIRDYLSDAEIVAQLAEEASELAQVALKLRRVLDGTNPTLVALKKRWIRRLMARMDRDED